MTEQLSIAIPATPRAWLFGAAIALVIDEFIDAFHPHNDLISGIILALLVAACALWLRFRKSPIPAIILLVLTGLELAALVFLYPHSPNPPTPFRSAIFILLTLAVVILSPLTIFRRGSSNESR